MLGTRNKPRSHRSLLQPPLYRRGDPAVNGRGRRTHQDAVLGFATESLAEFDQPPSDASEAAQCGEHRTDAQTIPLTSLSRESQGTSSVRDAAAVCDEVEAQTITGPALSLRHTEQHPVPSPMARLPPRETNSAIALVSCPSGEPGPPSADAPEHLATSITDGFVPLPRLMTGIWGTYFGDISDTTGAREGTLRSRKAAYLQVFPFNAGGGT